MTAKTIGIFNIGTEGMGGFLPHRTVTLVINDGTGHVFHSFSLEQVEDLIYGLTQAHRQVLDEVEEYNKGSRR